MATIPNTNPINMNKINQNFYTAGRRFNLGDPEIRCLINAVSGLNPPTSGFPLSGSVNLGGARGRPSPGSGTISYTTPGDWTCVIPVHQTLFISVYGAGGGGGGMGQHHWSWCAGCCGSSSDDRSAGGNGKAGGYSSFSLGSYGTLRAEGGSGGRGGNQPDPGGGVGGASTTGGAGATISNGGGAGGGWCPIYTGSTQLCFGGEVTYSSSSACAWCCCCNDFASYIGAAGGYAGGLIYIGFTHYVSAGYSPWATASGTVSASLHVGAGGAAGTWWQGTVQGPPCSGGNGAVYVVFG